MIPCLGAGGTGQQDAILAEEGDTCEANDAALAGWLWQTGRPHLAYCTSDRDLRQEVLWREDRAEPSRSQCPSIPSPT